MIRRPPRSTQGVSSAASDVYKRQVHGVFIFTRNEWAISFYYAAGALFYGCYLVIDSFVIKESNDVDDYILASIIIYVDIIRIFIYVLAALSKKRQIQSHNLISCLLYTSPSPRDLSTSRMPSSA
eukprot:TRINITY_DN26495_c0_g1_i1.p2 TRINITY_DN26495_c0_g1~~TRINITY_DN26495_c0_g1_i1.p2  ORF type:complete len:125 (+),score=22.77 TRINITY_DN26495_c0_g1_i1:75-449(+)